MISTITSSIFYRPCPTDSKFMVTQHIHNSYLRDGHLEKIRALGHGCTDQQPTIAPTPDRDIWSFTMYNLGMPFNEKTGPNKKTELKAF